MPFQVQVVLYLHVATMCITKKKFEEFNNGHISIIGKSFVKQCLYRSPKKKNQDFTSV